MAGVGAAHPTGTRQGIVGRILKGEKPSDFIATHTDGGFVNLKTGKVLDAGEMLNLVFLV